MARNPSPCNARQPGGEPFDNGTYIYAWYDADGNQVAFSDDGQAVVTAEGEYSCLVQDYGVGLVTSDTARVYSAAPLDILMEGGSYRTLDSSTDVAVLILGGLAPYEVEFDLDGEHIEQNPRVEQRAIGVSAYVSAFETGEYSVLVQDAAGQSAIAFQMVYGPELTILQQPESGEIPKQGTRTLEMIINGGTPPFQYRLMKVDKDDVWAWEYQTSDSRKASFSVGSGGQYCLEAVDADMRFARSRTVSLSDYVDLTIDHISVVAATPDRHCTQQVSLSALPRGGTEPYTYLWEKWSSDEGYHLVYTGKDDTASDRLSKIGERYRVTVTDAQGDQAVAGPMEAYYGGPLVITREPKNVQLEFSKKGFYSTSLTCEAMANGQWENWNNELEYTWQEKGLDGWKDCSKKGPTLQVSKGTTDVLGRYCPSYTYRCKVTNPETQEEICSREATVFLPQVRAWAKQVDKSNTIILNIEGGYAPYTVSCQRSRNSWDSSDIHIHEDYDLTGRLIWTGEIGSTWREYTISNVSKHARKYDPWGMVYNHRYYAYTFYIKDSTGRLTTCYVQMKGDAPAYFY